MLAGFTHRPVVELSERLAALAPPGLGPRVLRLGRRVGHRDRAQDELPLLAQPRPARRSGASSSLAGSYHGETLGALAVTDVALFRDAYAPLLVANTRRCRVPTRARGGGAGRRAPRRARRALARHHATTAALIVEPLVQGAAGMAMYDPRYLALARETVRPPRRASHRRRDHDRASAAPGTLFAWEQAGAGAPDFLCLSKGITGGYLPLSCVLTTDDVYARVLCRRHRARLPAFALLHRQPAGLPRRAGRARHLRRATT